MKADGLSGQHPESRTDNTPPLGGVRPASGGEEEERSSPSQPSRSFWLGLTREQLTRAVLIRNRQQRRDSRAHAMACVSFMRRHRVQRIPAVEPPAIPSRFIWGRRASALPRTTG